jgi:excisionase family DNA binding protein
MIYRWTIASRRGSFVASAPEIVGPLPFTSLPGEKALPRFLTIPEAASLLRINKNTAYEWALEHQLPGAFRVGGHWRVCRDRLLRYARESSVPSPGESER